MLVSFTRALLHLSPISFKSQKIMTLFIMPQTPPIVRHTLSFQFSLLYYYLSVRMRSEGYSTWFVCVSVCVCLSDTLFLRRSKLICLKEGIYQWLGHNTEQTFIRRDFPINASFKSYGIICLP